MNFISLFKEKENKSSTCESISWKAKNYLAEDSNAADGLVMLQFNLIEKFKRIYYQLVK
jgi:hypothetical protein